MGFLDNKIEEYRQIIFGYLKRDEFKPLFFLLIETVSVFTFMFSAVSPNKNLLSIVSPIPSVLSLLEKKNSSNEVFGFAPYWKFDNLDNVDFTVLTTFSYFGIPVNSDGTLDTTDQGYITFENDKATKIFDKAHSNGTRVVLTLTNMDNSSIEQLLDNSNAQSEAINEAVKAVKDRGIDGINIDFEYVGDPGDTYRNEFADFVKKMRNQLHDQVPNSELSVSVYATSVKDPNIYDIAKLSRNSDKIFMMAYDFATTSSDRVIPTSPLYGYKEGQYWYDVSTAVDDFLKAMPADKLILGVPWYGYDYPVISPGVKVAADGGYTYWYKYWISPWYWVWRQGYDTYPAKVQTYASSKDVTATQSGWDNLGQVGWKAYKDDNGNLREFFMEDSKSLGAKYDFAKSKSLGGIGIWALGFDDNKSDMWQVLKNKFGEKLASANMGGTR